MRLLPALLLALGSLPAHATIVGSKHDLSTSSGTNQVCVFCHTPHQANAGTDGPLWNRVFQTSGFTMYSSNTLDSTISTQPRDFSLICLGCHDGVLAYVTHNGNSVSTKHDLINAPGAGGIPDTSSYPNCARCHPTIYGQPSNDYIWLGQDLSDDHPVSVAYPTTAVDPAFNAPPDTQVGWWSPTGDDLHLYNGYVECATCHNPHKPDYGAFLRVSNAGSAMCLQCHVK